MGTSTGHQTEPTDSVVLRKVSDILQIVYPCSHGEAYVLQFGDAESTVIFAEGGSLVWTILALCDGTRTVAELTAELQGRFNGPESLWRDDIPKLLDDLLAWHAVEAVHRDHREQTNAVG